MLALQTVLQSKLLRMIAMASSIHLNVYEL